MSTTEKISSAPSSIKSYLEDDVLYFDLLSEIWTKSLLTEYNESIIRHPEANMIVLDFARLKELSSDDFAGLEALLLEGSKKPKGVILLGSPNIVAQIEQKNITHIARAVVAKAYEQVDVSPFTSETFNLFSKSLAQSIENLTQVKSVPVMDIDSELTGESPEGLTTFSINGARGCWTASFAPETLIGLISKVMGEEQTLQSPGLKDWVAEFLNMASPCVKDTVAKAGQKIEFDIPKVATSAEINELRKAKTQKFTQYFKTEFGMFRTDTLIE